MRPPIVRNLGFSLMEIMVALFLVGLILSLAAQSSMGIYERWQQSIEMRQIKSELTNIRNRAFVERRDILLEQEFAATVELPDGWSVRVITDPLYNRFGQCRPGEVWGVAPTGREYPLIIEPPKCRAVQPS